MRRMILTTLAILFLLTSMPFVSALAETSPSGTASPTPETTPTPTPTPALAAEQSSELLTSTDGFISTTTFGTDSYVIGLFSKITKGFNIGDWNLLDAQLTLSFSTTQLVSELLSSITISINGVRFYSEEVPVTDGLRRELTVKIPIEHLVSGYNSIAIEGYIRTYSGLPCVDDVTSANWMNIFAESFVEISYTPAASCTSIDEFYTNFTSIDALENGQSAVAVATGFDDDEICAAFMTLAGVSKSAMKDYQNVDLLAADSLLYLRGKKYVIYIAKPENLPAELKEAATQAQSDGFGACLLLLPGTETNVLVVVANDGAGLTKAAAELSNATTMHQLKGTLKIIDADEDVFVRKEGVTQYTPLTTTGTYLDGPFRQEVSYFINFENNRQLAYGSELELYFRYSENIDFDRSLVSVYVNDVPIGSQKLSSANANGDVLVLDIPTDIEVTGSFTLRVAFDLEIKDLWCTLRQEDTPWAYISSESTLKLNSTEVPYYLFENYPYPFISEGEFNDVVMVIPESNTDIDLTQMGNFMLTLGQYLKYNTGSMSVVRANAPGDLDGKNVIVVGTYENNAVVRELNDDLFFQFNDDGVGIQSNEKLLIEEDYGKTLATAQMIESPYSEVRNAILVLASTREADLENALSYFGDTTSLWKLTGDGFVADSDEMFAYRFKEDNAKEEETTSILERSDVMNVLYIGIAVLVLLAAGLVFIVLRYRRKVK